ncbi:hypothetical protein BJV74DRAFT_865425 [Russula compacta]|nr:hypothetical protein BJV74DRAFT_865425 [Russula compacta]
MALSKAYCLVTLVISAFCHQVESHAFHELFRSGVAHYQSCLMEWTQKMPDSHMQDETFFASLMPRHVQQVIVLHEVCAVNCKMERDNSAIWSNAWVCDGM